VLEHLSEENWLVRETDLDPHEINFHETIFTVGNGYQGTRGSFEEGRTGELSGTYLAGVYDHHDSTVPDLVNAPSWLPLTVFVEGHRLDTQSCKVLEHSRTLDLQQGLLHRDTLLEDSKGRRTRIKSIRFCSFANQHLCGIRISITPENHDSRFNVEAGIEGERYNLDRLPVYVEKPRFDPEVKWEKWAKSRHLRVIVADTGDASAYLEAETLDTGHVIGCATSLELAGIDVPARPIVGYETAAQRIEFAAAAGDTVVLDKFAAIFTSRDEIEGQTLREACEKLVHQAAEYGFPRCVAASAEIWRGKWDDCDIEIVGDDEATRAARFNIYHLLITANEHDPRVNVGAKSMSGEGYKGHVFWDTEIFLLPFYIYTQPETAKALLRYRHHTLPGAIENARINGFAGAQYAWESTDSGAETTPKWTADGAHRIWTGEEEIHVTADVAYGVLTYVMATDDWAFMRQYGAEILYQTSRFWMSRLEHNEAADRYELSRVIGPDEFHEHVDNNTFTNRMAQWHLDGAARIFDKLSADDSGPHRELLARLGLTPDEVAEWRAAAAKVFIPFDPGRNLIEQFAGYFKLEDIPITNWDENDMPVYPDGYDHFNLNGAMLLKQPDVVMLMYLLPDEFTDEAKKANFEFYEARTLHKSSLSPAIHAIMGIEVGDVSSAHRYFLRSALVDMANNQDNTEDGIHIASAGGTWQSLVCGFGGFRVKHGRMTFRPWLPAQWKELRFKIRWRDAQVAVTIAREEAHFRLAAAEGRRETIEVDGREITLEAGRKVVAQLKNR
jgi:kojibiose phosphorylase